MLSQSISQIRLSFFASLQPVLRNMPVLHFETDIYQRNTTFLDDAEYARALDTFVKGALASTLIGASAHLCRPSGGLAMAPNVFFPHLQSCAVCFMTHMN